VILKIQLSLDSISSRQSSVWIRIVNNMVRDEPVKDSNEYFALLKELSFAENNLESIKS
jgi:hypothetical protein